MVWNKVLTFSEKDAEIIGAEPSLLELTCLGMKKKPLYVDDYSRKIIELGPISPIIPCSELSSDSLTLSQSQSPHKGL